MSSSKSKYEVTEKSKQVTPLVRLENALNAVSTSLDNIKSRIDQKTFYNKYSEKQFEELNTSVSELQRAIHLVESEDTVLPQSLSTSIKKMNGKCNELVLWNLNGMPAGIKAGQTGKEIDDNIRNNKILLDALCVSLTEKLQPISSTKLEKK